MKLILLLSTALIVKAGVIKENNQCNETLKADLDRPYLLAVDHSTNTLYFSYSVLKDDDVFKTARLDLDTGDFKTIDDVQNGFAQTVDPETNNVYIGGSNGLYKYDYKKHKSEFIAEKETNIWTVYFKEVLYYSIFPSQFLYIYSNGESSRFVDLQDTKVDQFIIDGDDDIFFTNATGLYQQKKGTDNATLYEKLPYNGARGITMDVKGQVHVCYQDGIYAVNKETQTLNKVLETEDAFGVAFDKENNIIYGDATKVIRLKKGNC